MKRLDINYIHFHIDEGKRTICAYATDIDGEIISEVLKTLSNTDIYITPDTFSNVPTTVRGVARCSKQDRWDENIGKRVALAKLNRSYARMQLKVIKQIKKEIDEAEQTIEKTIWQLEDRIDRTIPEEDF